MVVQSMQDDIETNIDCKTTLGELANHVGYSESYVSRIFKELVNILPIDYIRARKLFLTIVNMDIYNYILEIALNAGFQSHEGLTRAFKIYKFEISE